MAKRAIIRLGDRTTHGGTVVTADPTYDVYGKKVARVGDKVSCPQCNGTFPIVSGAADVMSGQIVARQDDQTSCGAKLIATQFTAMIDDGSGDAGADTVAPVALIAALAPAIVEDEPEDEVYAMRFQAIDPDTGAPVPKCVYILTRENGGEHGGVADAEGFTEVIETTRPETISVHFVFKSPKGEPIDREDLGA